MLYLFLLIDNYSIDMVGGYQSEIAAGKILAQEINILGGLKVETVQMAHRLIEANQIYGKKLIMRIDRV
jgi:hypothetical protein